MPAARAQLEDFDGRAAIVVERFDRSEGKRVHQEDFAQALGISSRDKYETSSTGTTRLRTIAQDAGSEAIRREDFIAELLAQVAFNLLLGNGDAHAKNYSLAISSAATYSLTPLYDVAPVFLINKQLQHFGHVVDGQPRLPYITARHLLNEAGRWGTRATVVRRVLEQVSSRVHDAVASCEGRGIDVDVVAETIRTRAQQMLTTVRAD